MLFTKLRKPLALVLVFLMFFSMVPFGYAAELPASQFESGVDPPTEESLPEDDVSLTEPTIASSEPDTDSVPEDTIPETEPEPVTGSSEPSAEDVPQDGPGIMGLSSGDSSTWAIGSTQSSIMLFDFADNGNYTTVLNSQVTCAYKPNGSGTTRTAYIKNLGWHFARYGGVPYPDDPLYCIEPWRSYAASTSGNSVDRDVTLDGSGSTTGSNVWYALPAARREAIGLILLYSNQMWNHSTLVSGPHTTNTSGKISVTGLTPGTYYVKEIGQTDSAINALYYCSSTNPQAVTVTAGGTASVSFTNKLNTGSVKLIKSTNTGANLSGWQIGLYTDSDCTNAVAGSPFVTGADGAVTVSGLQKGTYYAKEIPTDDPYWGFDTAVKSVTVAVAQTAEVTFTNTHYGRIEIRKTTNTGNQLGGWTFRVRDSEGNSYGDFTTDDNGYACTQNLPLGRYTVVELPTEDNYWLTELGFHDVTVKAGETTVDTWLNKEQGLVWFNKKTNTGESVEGWHITVFSDEACTQKVGTLITNADGKAGYYLDPGTYWAKETGDEHGRFEDEYWMVDETVHKFEIKPHEDVSITFTNVQYGRLKITKTVEGGGSVEGWQFKITDAEGKVLDGSPFSTDEDGIILTGNLLPGQYTVEELLPQDSLYECKGDNPQTVTITQGEIAEVAFVNALRTGKVTVEKIDITGSPLAGATFRLEWSAEGSLWYPVTYSETIVRGGCSNPDVVDGGLTTGTDGILEWGNLYPGLQYRLTETKAPDGYNLLDGTAFEGELAADNMNVSLRVVNTRTYTLPKTGSSGLRLFPVFALIPTFTCSSGLALSILRKRRS